MQRRHVQLNDGVHVLVEADGTVQVIVLRFGPGRAPPLARVEAVVGGRVELGPFVAMPDGVGLATGRRT